MRRMDFQSLIIKCTDTKKNNVFFKPILFYKNNYWNARQCYVLRTLFVILEFSVSFVFGRSVCLIINYFPSNLTFVIMWRF